MKRLLLVNVIIVLAVTSALGQVPEGFKYQAVLRNSVNEVLVNQEVGIQFTIRQGSIGGTAVYTEEFTDTSNVFGLVNLEIGTGVTFDNFALIDWSNGPYFIQTAIDLSGGTSYTDMGGSQLMSVPYALHAKASTAFNESVASGITTSDTTFWNNDADQSPTNELQTLSFRAPNQLSLTNGGTVNLGVLSDNMGNHISTTNIQLAGNFLSGDGDNEGIAVDNIGEVGIGTATPNAALHIAQEGSSINDGIRLTSFLNTTEDWYVYMSASDDFSIRDDGILVITVENSSHNVGIGTSSPTATLSVNGTANKIGGGSWAVFSDRRIKRDIVPYEDGLKELLQISPVKFKYIDQFALKESPNKEFVGVIAQEIKQVAPYMVETLEYKAEKAESEDKEQEDATKDQNLDAGIQEGQEMLSYDPSALVYMLVNSVKEQQKLIEELNEKNRDLNMKIQSLTKRLNGLENK